MTRWLLPLALPMGLALTGGAPLVAQSSLPEAAERARAAWLAHNPEALVGQSGSLVLQIPGADPSSPLERPQAAELLRRHWRSAVERWLTVGAVREVEPGEGYVELERRYVVSGTSDERRETVFLGFRKAGGRWLLTELRSGP
ncbi:MAG TPA: hypothetical protein VEK78_16495 [Gemmatimonadales bacterium]|nr:hypothetical protein [Gemmatimonadales bacterium]